jgi:hypothetical protein
VLPPLVVESPDPSVESPDPPPEPPLEPPEPPDEDVELPLVLVDEEVSDCDVEDDPPWPL